VTTTVDDNGPCLPNACSLREAVLAAHGTLENDIVLVPAGVHLLTIPTDPADTSTGPIWVLGIEIEIRGLGGPTEVVVDANQIDYAFVISTGSDVVLSDLTIRNARGLSAGGVFSGLSNLLVERCIFKDNEAWNGFGGGLRISGNATVRDSTFVGNTAFRGGGGIYVAPTGHLAISNSTITGNSALGGGAIGVNGGAAEIVHTTIADNAASPAGSGDGLLARFAEVSVANSLFADDCFYYQAPFPTSNGRNLESPAATCFDPADGDLVATDPLLLPLTDNGGPTPTRALLPKSLAVDAASRQECEPVDQRGVVRPRRSGCDIGAFELEEPGVLEVPTLGVTGHLLLASLLAGFGLALLQIRRTAAGSEPGV
jgi:CSLREA domain-containing protein